MTDGNDVRLRRIWDELFAQRAEIERNADVAVADIRVRAARRIRPLESRIAQLTTTLASREAPAEDKRRPAEADMVGVNS